MPRRQSAHCALWLGARRPTTAKLLPPLCLLIPVRVPLARWLCSAGRSPLPLCSSPGSTRERARAFPVRGSSGLRARRGTSSALPSAASSSLRSFAPAIRHAASTPPPAETPYLVCDAVLALCPISQISSPSCGTTSLQLLTRFSSQSHLLPIRILLTPSLACCSMFECHVRMSGGSHSAPQ
jgi:hypothetical protein